MSACVLGNAEREGTALPGTPDRLCSELKCFGQLAQSAGSGQGTYYPNDGRAEQEVLGKRRTPGSFLLGSRIAHRCPERRC